MAKYPEHEKLRMYERECGTLSGFLDFLSERGWFIAEYTEKFDEAFSVHESNDQIIGLYLDIDPKKLGAEKNAMVDEIRTEDRNKESDRPPSEQFSVTD